MSAPIFTHQDAIGFLAAMRISVDATDIAEHPAPAATVTCTKRLRRAELAWQSRWLADKAINLALDLEVSEERLTGAQFAAACMAKRAGEANEQTRRERASRLATIVSAVVVVAGLVVARRAR